MKNIIEFKLRQMVSFVCAFVLLITQNSFSILAANQTESEIKVIKLSSNFAENLYARMTYNGSNKGEVIFEEYILPDIEADDEVKLTATAEYSDKTAKDEDYNSVILSNFALTGKDARKYTLLLPGEGSPVTSKGHIDKRTITYVPLDDSNNYTSDIYPKEIGIANSIKYKFDNVVNDDLVNITDDEIRLYIIKEDTGTYKYVLGNFTDENSINSARNIAIDNTNYIVSLDVKASPSITELSKPVVKSAVVTIDTTNKDNKLKYYNDLGIIANNSVTVSVTATAKQNLPVNFTLIDADEEIGQIKSEKGEFIENKNEYEFTADFGIELSDVHDSRIIENLRCKVDNGIEDEVALELQLEESNKKTKRLILDKDNPTIKSNSLKVSYDNVNKKIKFNGEFQDQISGIGAIEYRWDNKTEYIEYEIPENSKNSIVNMFFETDFGSDELGDAVNGKHTLYLKITDHAGNLNELDGNTYSLDDENGIDTKAPVVKNIKFNTKGKSELAKILRILSSGNYVKESLKLKLVVEDESESENISEVQSVVLLDGDNKLIAKPKDVLDDKYTFELNCNLEITELNVKMTDIYGNSSVQSLCELLKDLGTEDDINWSDLQSNRWVFDEEKPKIVVDTSSAVKNNGNFYYNNKGGIFSITITDNNGLDSVNITKEYQLLKSDEGIVESVDYLLSEDKKSAEYTINTKFLETGWYTYIVNAKDYAGNPSEKTIFTFYVDHIAPDGEIIVESSSLQKISGENWIKEKDELGSVQQIEFRLYPETRGSAFKKAIITVNGEQFPEYTSKDIKYDLEGKEYIDLIIDPTQVPYNSQNIYKVVANITTVAENTSEHILYDLHVDTQDPVISKFTVGKKNSGLEKVLNVLSFGAFCNDAIILTVTVSDGNNDVGLDYVIIKHDGLEEPVKMELKSSDSSTNNNEYSFELALPEGTKIFESNIVVTAYDKLGKHSIGLPNISNVEDDGNISDNHFVMIETVSPTATIELPTGDGAVRNDKQVWYNTDKDINLEIEDLHSGIREVKVTVTVGDEEIIIEKDKNGSEILSAQDTKTNQIRIISYVFSIDEIADMIKKYNNQKYTVRCEVVDNAGNVGYAEEKVYYRDVTNPTIQKFSFVPETVDNDKETKVFVDNLEYGYYFRDKSKLVVTVNDTKDVNGNNVPSSGFDKVIFRLVSRAGDGKEEIIEVDVTYNQAECLIPKGFKGQIYAQVFDKVGNESKEKTSRAFVVDGEKPNVTIEPLPDNKSKTDDIGNKLYTGKVQFKVTVSDTKSGLRKISYSKSSDLDSFNAVVTEIEDAVQYNNNDVIGHGWKITKMDANLVTEVSQVFTFDKDDKNIFMTFNSTDNSKNDGVEKKSETFTIDTASPIVKKFNFEPLTEDNISEVDDFIEELEYGFYFKKEFNAVVSVEDSIPSSGLDKVVFGLVSYDNGEIVSVERQKISIKNKKATCKIPAGFKGQIYVTAYDRANNKSNEKTPQAFVVDENPPVITIEPLPNNYSKKDMDGNKLYTETVQFRVTISDEKSGLREIVYSKNSEQDSFNNVVTTISNTSGYDENIFIGNGWQVTKTDENLATEVSQVFTFSTDDNNISMNFCAIDRSKNTCEIEKSESFTIDTISPKVTISNSSKPINDMYYKGSTTYVITVAERNFDASRMIAEITNTYTSAQPAVDFVRSSSDSNVYVATVTFPEGDYDFTFSGTDCGGHKADINVNGNAEIINYFHTSFNVDATAPQVSTNFEEFGNVGDEEIYFNSSKTAIIEIIEHNFDEYDMDIIVKSKFSGTSHSDNSEDWYKIGYSPDWVHNGDKHTLQIVFDKDAIYRISISPVDRAGNKSQNKSSAIYEIDTKSPELYSRNNKLASEENFVSSPYYEIYDEKKKDSAAPSVEFEDLNFDRIEIKAVIYRPEYRNGMEFGEIAIDPLSDELSVPVNNKKFSLPNFDKDGVYSITYVAVDKAGNKSEPISDTYFRMVDTDVLAYISNSNIESHTGYYSLMDEDGKAISKKATDFKDLDIVVIKLKQDNEAGVLALREDDQEYSPNEYITVENKNISETAIISKTHLPASYFSETFRDDSLDTRMYLSVSIRNGVYLDLASIHIDNEPPTATLPNDFVSWHNYLFTNETTISLTNISETLNVELCKIYECPRSGRRTEIPFKYDKENKTLSFVLQEGLHNIDVTLVDEAGNEWNVDRVRYLRVGNFRLYLGIGIGVFLMCVIIGIALWRKKKQN